MPSVADKAHADLAALGYNTGSVADREAAWLINTKSVTGMKSIADKAKSLNLPALRPLRNYS